MIEEELNEKIGQNIKKYRLIYNANVGKMTQKDLAESVRVSTPLIGSLESKKINQGVSIYNLYKICEVLGITIDKLFE